MESREPAASQDILDVEAPRGSGFGGGRHVRYSFRLRGVNLAATLPTPPAPVRERPTHVTLAVVFQVRDSRLGVLLWQRAREPFSGAWSLPGGYLEPGETLERSIRRQLAAKVDVREVA